MALEVSPSVSFSSGWKTLPCGPFFPLVWAKHISGTRDSLAAPWHSQGCMLSRMGGCGFRRCTCLCLWLLEEHCSKLVSVGRGLPITWHASHGGGQAVLKKDALSRASLKFGQQPPLSLPAYGTWCPSALFGSPAVAPGSPEPQLGQGAGIRKPLAGPGWGWGLPWSLVCGAAPLLSSKLWWVSSAGSCHPRGGWELGMVSFTQPQVWGVPRERSTHGPHQLPGVGWAATAIWPLAYGGHLLAWRRSEGDSHTAPKAGWGGDPHVSRRTWAEVEGWHWWGWGSCGGATALGHAHPQGCWVREGRHWAGKAAEGPGGGEGEWGHEMA